MATRAPKNVKQSKPKSTKSRKSKATPPKESPKGVEEVEVAAPEVARKKVRLVRPKPKRKIRLVRRAEQEEAQDTQDLSSEDFVDEMADDFAQSEGVRNMARSVLDAVMPDLVKRIVAAGGEALSEESMRTLIEEAVLRKAGDGEGAEPLPESKGLRGEFQRVLSREIQKFLGGVDLSGEIQKILTSLTFEVRTEIRFVPNEDQVRPKIKNRVRVKRSKE